MKRLWICFRDWWRGYTDAEMLSMSFKMRDRNMRFPDDLTRGEARAFIQSCSVD